MPRSRSLFAFCLLLSLGLSPTPAQAQFDTFNFCTIFEQFPNTSGVESALFESWNDAASEWAPNERWVISYQNGNPVEFQYQERTQTGAWADSARTLASYDPSDRLTECTIQSVDGGSFENLVRSLRSYNAEGQLDEEIFQSWETNSAGAWVDAQRSTYTYDGSGNLTQRVDEFWDDGAQTWISATRTQNSYDGSNRLTERVVQQADGSGGWLNAERTRNTYGPNGLSETLEETWDLIFQTWRNDRRTLFTSPSGDTEVETEQRWIGSAWENETRLTTQSNASDLPATLTEEQWTGSAWVNADRTQNSYETINGSQKFTQSVEQTWVPGSSTWANADRTTLSYDGVIPVELASFQAWSTSTRAVLQWRTASETNNAGFEVHHRPESEASWRTLGFVESNVSGGTTSDPQSYRFRSGPLALGTHAFRLRQVDLDGSATLTDPITVTVRLDRALRLTAPLPHPVSDQATVTFALDRESNAEVALYNLLGQRVRVLHEGPVAPNRDHTVTLDTQGLSSGRYVLRLQAGDRTRSHAITVIR